MTSNIPTIIFFFGDSQNASDKNMPDEINIDVSYMSTIIETIITITNSARENCKC